MLNQYFQYWFNFMQKLSRTVVQEQQQIANQQRIIQQQQEQQRQQEINQQQIDEAERIRKTRSGIAGGSEDDDLNIIE